ncbi:class I SAM-dependent methyltransferase [Pseudoduganella ginsengisoli]|uniref:Methyltransferase domain-containing protein n=1 Tax=Pseudoduganella ginsengisoli TaxID=1462440 RepID=A0A6L6Q074_9BURK|nr:class I SAM-dependent methyltransferase [Pseudoduganella ginsengisoli]MTW02648.1 methyltransferase domain-containing protein [Pseudoduganella ginsengisoli]
MKNYKHRDDCRLCGSTQFELVLPIKPSPIGDAFVKADQLNEPQELFPLDTYICLDCGHVQNLDIVDPDILFRNYTYRTSSSLGLVQHFQEYAKAVVEKLAIQPGALVVEIGSNDGSLLKAYKALGLRVQGVDPAKNIAAGATAEGVPTHPDFFSSAVAKELRAELGPAQLMCANNVFAHADQIGDIVAGIRTLLAPDGAFVFEVSYIPDMVDHFVFDTIYHEHVSHHSLLPLERFFRLHDMTLFDVERVATKGGSIRAFAQPLSTGQRPRSERLQAMFAEEERRGITQPEIYRQFYKDIEVRKRAVLDVVDRAIAEGKTVAGYGASTTATTLLYHFELESRLKYIVDDNPIKWDTFSPGAHLPVHPSTELVTRKPDLVVILAWMYVKPITAKHGPYMEQGGQFLVPLPALQLIPAAK